MKRIKKSKKLEKEKEIRSRSLKTEGITKGVEEHIQTLKKGRRNSLSREQASAIKALVAIGGHEGFGALVEVIKEGGSLIKSHALWRQSETANPEAAGLFENAFNDESDPFSSNSRRYALAGLGKINNPRTFRIVAKALKDEDWIIRVDACRILGSIEGADAVDKLAGLAEDTVYYVRIALAETLGRISSPKRDEILERLLEDRNPWVKAWSAKALGKSGDSKTIEVLTQIIESSQSEDIKRFAQSVLDEVGNQKSV